MYNYERIHQKSRDLANKMIQAYVRTECLKTYSKNKRQLLLEFEEFHRINMIDNGLNPEEYENIVDTAIKLFRKDWLLSNLMKPMYLIKTDPTYVPPFKISKESLKGIKKMRIEDIRKDIRKIEDLIKIEDHIKNMLKNIKSKETDPELPEKVEKKEKFITLNHPDYFYQELASEINACYAAGAYTSVLILSRKLIENLLIDVLRKKYGDEAKKDVEMYYRTDSGRFHDFNTLLRHLNKQKVDFEVDEEILKEFFKLVRPFRKSANKKAHSIVHVIGKKEELKEFEVQKLASLLVRLYNNI